MIVKCNVCGKEFKTFPCVIKDGGGKYCSKECMFQSSDYIKKISETLKGITPWNKGKTGVYSEETLKQISDSQKGEKNHNYGKVRTEETKRKIGLANKGRKISNEARKKMSESHKGKKLSEEHKKKIGLHEIGEKHWNWKGGLTPENKVIRHSMEYRFWRREVFKRDDYTCQKCGVRGGVIRAHHIESFDNNPDKRILVDNGVTLCKECHRNFHHIFGCGNNTQEQLAKFLENKQKDLLFDK